MIFGGGLPLYDGGIIVGALGVSGDTSPGDHNVAWRVRKTLALDRVPAGISADNNDAIIYDINMLGKSSSGYGHPVSGLKAEAYIWAPGQVVKLFKPGLPRRMPRFEVHMIRAVHAAGRGASESYFSASTPQALPS